MGEVNIGQAGRIELSSDASCLLMCRGSEGVCQGLIQGRTGVGSCDSKLN